MPSHTAPCPFDHPVRRGTIIENLDGHHHVVCLDCGATGPDRRTFADALEAWNSRRKRNGDGDGKRS
jgi:hypothetical protein